MKTMQIKVVKMLSVSGKKYQKDETIMVSKSMGKRLIAQGYAERLIG